MRPNLQGSTQTNYNLKQDFLEPGSLMMLHKQLTPTKDFKEPSSCGPNSGDKPTDSHSPPRLWDSSFSLRSWLPCSIVRNVEVLQKKEIKRMQTFVNHCTLGMLNVRQRHMHDDQVTMVDLRRRLGIPSVAVAIRLRQLRWLGHIARLPDERLEKQALWMWHELHGPGRRSRRKSSHGTIDTAPGLWAVLQDMQKTLQLPADTWATQWMFRAQLTVAASGDLISAPGRNVSRRLRIQTNGRFVMRLEAAQKHRHNNGLVELLNVRICSKTRQACTVARTATSLSRPIASGCMRAAARFLRSSA